MKTVVDLINGHVAPITIVETIIASNANLNNAEERLDAYVSLSWAGELYSKYVNPNTSFNYSYEEYYELKKNTTLGRTDVISNWINTGEFYN